MNLIEEIETLARADFDIVGLAKRYASVTVADLIHLSRALSTPRTDRRAYSAPVAWRRSQLAKAAPLP